MSSIRPPRQCLSLLLFPWSVKTIHRSCTVHRFRYQNVNLVLLPPTRYLVYPGQREAEKRPVVTSSDRKCPFSIMTFPVSRNLLTASCRLSISALCSLHRIIISSAFGRSLAISSARIMAIISLIQALNIQTYTCSHHLTYLSSEHTDIHI